MLTLSRVEVCWFDPGSRLIWEWFPCFPFSLGECRNRSLRPRPAQLRYLTVWRASREGPKRNVQEKKLWTGSVTDATAKYPWERLRSVLYVSNFHHNPQNVIRGCVHICLLFYFCIFYSFGYFYQRLFYTLIIFIMFDNQCLTSNSSNPISFQHFRNHSSSSRILTFPLSKVIIVLDVVESCIFPVQWRTWTFWSSAALPSALSNAWANSHHSARAIAFWVSSTSVIVCLPLVIPSLQWTVCIWPTSYMIAMTFEVVHVPWFCKSAIHFACAFGTWFPAIDVSPLSWKDGSHFTWWFSLSSIYVNNFQGFWDLNLLSLVVFRLRAL